jgi:hypothetical protein
MKRSLATAARATSGGGALRLVPVGLIDRGAEGPRAKSSLDFAEISSRMAIAAAFTFLAVRLGADFLHTGRFTSLLLLASEALVVVLTVFRRPTGIVDRSVPARVLTTVSLIGPLLVGLSTSAVLLPETATVALSAIGLLIVIGGKLSLGRSFGLMPANRGIVSTGLYRLVRHPHLHGVPDYAHRVLRGERHVLELPDIRRRRRRADDAGRVRRARPRARRAVFGVSAKSPVESGAGFVLTRGREDHGPRSLATLRGKREANDWY